MNKTIKDEKYQLDFEKLQTASRSQLEAMIISFLHLMNVQINEDYFLNNTNESERAYYKKIK